MQDYILMNRNYKTAYISVDSDSICEMDHTDSVVIKEIYDLDRLPFPVQYTSDEFKADEMRKWILKRLIPDNRDGIKRIYDAADIKNRFELSMMARGQTITDGYWFRNPSEKISYDNISYKKNKFPYDVGNLMFGLTKAEIDFNSPDLTTNGWLKKSWRISNNRMYLLKQGSAPHFEEPYNEVIATKVLEKFCKVPFVRYKLQKVNGIVCSVCESFIKDGVEFIPANQVYNTKMKASFETPDMHLRERCKHFQIPGYKDFLDHMRYIDYVMSNTDRHLGNFGFLYDMDRLKFIGPAPLFDHGTSLWNADEMPPKETEEKSEELFASVLSQIKHPSRLEIPKDFDVSKIICEVYEGSGIDSDKIDAIAKLSQQRCDVSAKHLERAAKIELKKKKERGYDER